MVCQTRAWLGSILLPVARESTGHSVGPGSVGSSALHPQNAPPQLLLVFQPREPKSCTGRGVALRCTGGSRTPLRLPMVREGACFLPSPALNSVGVPEIQVSRQETMHFPALLCKGRGCVRGSGYRARGVPRGAACTPAPSRCSLADTMCSDVRAVMCPNAPRHRLLPAPR